jgi:putative transposase
VFLLILNYKYRIYPNKTQKVWLLQMVSNFCDLYNAALQERVDAYRKRKITLGYFDQASELKEARIAEPELAQWSVTAEQQVLRKVDHVFKAFFSRRKQKTKAGMPRFRPHSRYHSVLFRVGDGLSLRKTGKARIIGIPGEIKIRWHRTLPDKPKTVVVSYKNGKWFATFSVEVGTAATPINNATIGIDVGLTTLMALSNGTLIPRPNFTKQSAKKLKRLQRALRRCKRGSKRRQKAKLRFSKYHSYIARRRADFLHKISANVASKFGIPKMGGLAAELSATISEECFRDLEAPVARVAGLDTPIPFSLSLEKYILPGKDAIVKGVQQVLV